MKRLAALWGAVTIESIAGIGHSQLMQQVAALGIVLIAQRCDCQQELGERLQEISVGRRLLELAQALLLVGVDASQAQHPADWGGLDAGEIVFYADG